MLILQYSYSDSFLQNTLPDVLYRVDVQTLFFPDDNLGESAKRIIKKVKYYDGKNTKSHILKHGNEKEHEEVTQEKFKFISKIEDR